MKVKKRHFRELERDVIKRGLCARCGTCAGVCPLDSIDCFDYGKPPLYDRGLDPVLVGKCNSCGLCYEACPGERVPLPAIDEMLFGRRRDTRHEPLGIFKECLAAHAVDETIRAAGASGGVGTALLTYALREGLIDGSIVSIQHPEFPWRAGSMVAVTEEEMLSGASSHYQASPQLALIPEAIKRGLKSIALTCDVTHTHGFRKMQMLGLKRAGIVKFTLGLFCGSSCAHDFTYFDHYLTELFGIDKIEDIVHYNYRGGKPPKHRIAVLRDGSRLEAGSWQGSFVLNQAYRRDKSLMVYDYGNEVADIALGECVEPWMKKGAPGWSTILTRTAIGEQVVKGAIEKGYIFARPTAPERVAAFISCTAKKHGMNHAIKWKREHGWPAPDFGYPLDNEELEPWPAQFSMWRWDPRVAGDFGVK